MTLLSWALYASSVLGSFNELAEMSIVLLSIAAVISFAIGYVENSASAIKSSKTLLNWMIVAAIVAIILPGSTTVNRIIAVETANYVAETPEAQAIKEKILIKINESLE